MVLTQREMAGVYRLAGDMSERFYELVCDNLSEIMEADSAKEVSEKIEEGYIELLRILLDSSVKLYERGHIIKI